MRKELALYCRVGHRRLTDEAINRGYSLFERALVLTRDDPRARSHVEAAKIPFQHTMFKFLPGDDQRLKKEAVEFFRVAKEVELGVVDRKSIADYRDKLSRKLGVELAEEK